MKKIDFTSLFITLLICTLLSICTSCKKPQTCQECTIFTKLVDGGGESTSQYTNCGASDATGAETVVIKDNRIIARSTYICGAFITK